MAATNLFTVSLLVILSAHTTQAGSYQGCYAEDRSNRHYNFNPGDYDPDNINPQKCAAQCGSYKKTYAALAFGRFCFCGDTAPLAPSVANTFCQTLCSGDPTSKCGGTGYVSVYMASQPIVGLTLTSSASTTAVLTGAPVTFGISITSGLDVYYRMDYDTGSGQTEKNATGMASRAFYLPGTYSVSVEANDFNDTLLAQTAVTTVTVKEPVGGVEIVCDVVFATFDEGKCVATVYQGTDLAILAVVDTFSDTFDIADPVQTAVGPGIKSKDTPLDPPYTGTIIAPASLVETAGRVVGFELYAKTAGVVKVLILRPGCGATYCLESNTCSGCPAGGNSAYMKSCAAPNLFCPLTRVCDTNTASCPAAARFSAAAPRVTSYTVKEIISVTVTTGYQYVKHSLPSKVTPGDILGYDEVSSVGKLYWLDCPPDRTNFMKAGAVALGATITSSTVTAAGSGDCVSLRATVSEGSNVYLPYTFTAQGVYPLTITARNRDNSQSEVNTTDVTVLEGVNFTVITAQDFVKTNVAYTYTIEPHTGKAGALYVWNMGDGSLFENVTDQSRSHTYTAAGTYNMTATTFNAVSSKSNFTEVVVQNEVLGLALASSTTVVPAGTAETNVAHGIKITLTSGTDYNCTWNFGDGTATTTTGQLTTPVGTTNVPHTYTTIGTYTVSVTCANQVSTMTATLSQKVQERITGLALSQQGWDQALSVIVPWQLTTGFDVAWTNLTFASATMQIDTIASSTVTRRWMTRPLGVLSPGTYAVVIIGSNDINTATITSNFVLTTALKGVTVTCDTFNTTTGKTVTITVSATAGSDVTVDIDWKDGSTYNHLFPGAWVGPSKAITHVFNDGGRFAIAVNVSNPAGAVRAGPLEVLVIEGVNGIMMHSPHFALYAPPSIINVVFNVSAGKATPTEPKCLMDLRDGHGEVQFHLVLDYDYGMRFDDTGEYLMNATVSNVLDSKSFNRDLIILEMLVTPQLKPVAPFTKAPLNQPLDIEFSLFRGPFGPLCNLSWVFGNGVTVFNQRQGSGMWGVDTQPVTYTTKATYTITVTATSPLESVYANYVIDVIDPVLEANLQVTVTPAEQIFQTPTEITVTWDNLKPNPQNALITVDWGDGSTPVTATNFTLPTTVLSHIMKADGRHNVTVTVYNEASRVVRTLEAGAWKDFTTPSIIKCFKPDVPHSLPCKKGLDDLGILFSADKDISFTFSTANNSLADYYEFTANHVGGNVFYCDNVSNPFSVSELTRPGVWDISIRAVNPMYQKTVSTTLTIVELVVGFQLSHNESEKNGGVPKSFTLSFQNVGSQTCVFIDFGDNKYEVYADSISSCTLTGPYIGLTSSGPLSAPMTISHTYWTEKAYRVTMLAQNTYSSATQFLEFDITGLDCSSPQVEITGARKVFYDPQVFHKGDIIKFEGVPLIACANYANTKTWTVQEIDPEYGTPVATVTLTGITTSDAELSLPRWTLNYKLYKVTFQMKMNSANPALKFVRTDYSFFRVEYSSLVGTMVAGGSSEIVRGKGSGNLVLQPLDHSYDPDVLNNSPTTSGLSVDSWTCSVRNISDPYKPAVPCPVDMTSLTNAKLGTAGQLTYPMAGLTLAMTYNFTVKLSKDNRTCYASVDMFVVTGDPAQVEIDCAAGSFCHQLETGFMVLQSERLGFRATCTNCLATDVVTYKWTFYLEDYRWTDQGGWRPLQQHDLSARTVAVDGSTSSELAILAEMFSYYSTIKKFKVECAITRNGIVGWASTRLFVNEPPKGGNCSITPRETVVTDEKLFRIRCENWVDSTGIELYEFFSYHDDTSVNVQITSVKTSLGLVDVMVAIGQGAPFRNYSTNVKAIVRDIYGASTVYEIDTVKVWPKPLAESRAFIKQMQEDATSVMQRKIAEGNVKDFTEFAASLAAIINSDSKRSQTEYQSQTMASFQSTTALSSFDEDRVGAYTQSSVSVSEDEERLIEEQRDTRAGLRESFVKALSELPRNDVLSRDQILSAMAESLKYPDEVTTNSRNYAMDTLLDMSKMLDSQESITPEQRNRNTRYMLSVLGSVMAAAGTTGFHGTLTEQEAAVKADEFMDYDTNNVAENDDCLRDVLYPKGFEEALKFQKIRTNCRLTRQNNQHLVDAQEQFMLNMKKSFMKNTILGESEQYNTDHQKTRFRKTEASKILQNEMTLENSAVSVTFDGNMSDVFTSGLIGANTPLMIEISETSNNPNRYTRMAKNLGQGTEFVSINLLTDSGPLRLSGMKKPLKVAIPRDRKQPKPAYKPINPKLTTWNEYQLHETEISKDQASLHVALCVEQPGIQFAVVFSLGKRPNHHDGRCNASFVVPPAPSSANTCSRIIMDNLQVSNYKGKVYLGVRQLMPNETGMNLTDCQLPDYWNNGTAEAQFTSNYTLQLFTSGCYAISEGEDDWTTSGLRVHEETDDTKTVCESTHLTTFAGGWVVAPNTIDWNFVFSNMDFAKNPTLYVTQIVIVVVYIVAVVWARRKDKKDVELLGIAPLMDNDPKDKYYYEIVVVTGMRRNAGTDSKVHFILSGEDEETDVREFSDSKRKIFRRGATNGFLVGVSRPLGYLNYARVWHDNSGKGNFGGWYLNYMIVRDVQTDERWVFIADRWFAVEEDDGMVDRIIPAASRERMTEFGHLFAERSRKNLADGHLWFSVVARPPASRFTAVQRVTCCLCLLYTSMLANAMFYRKDGESEPNGNGITIGPFSLSPEQIFIGVISNLIVFPVNFLVITLFRKARPRRKRPSRVDEAIKTAYENREASVNDVKPEVSSIFTMSRASSVVDPKRPETSFSRPGTSLSRRADGTLPTKKQKKSLPWWWRVISWIILWFAIIVSGAFVTFYGISFADETCKKWISSMLISFFMSVFITQPIKVFLMAIFLSLIVKNPGDDEEDEVHDEENTKLANDEIPLHTMNDAFGAARPRKIGYKPPDRAELEAAREKRLKEIQMWSVVREVIVYSFFLWILLVISYRNRNSNTFLYKDIMERVFIKNTDTDINYKAIRNADEYWVWTKSGLVNGIRAGPYYNNYPPLMLRGFTNDKVSKILGYATMRQLRVKPNLCEMDERMTVVLKECNVEYSMSNQQEGTFDIGWKPRTANSTANDTAEWYRYQSSDELNGYPYWGEMAVYYGGGYMVKLEGSKTVLMELMDRLRNESWIDRYTRAVIVEFTTYNAQVNLFGIATIIAEFDCAGGAVQSYRFEPALLLPYMTSAMLFQLVCEGVYVAFILFFIIRLIRVLFKEKLSFFVGFWNLVEMGIISTSLGGIIIYFYRMYETTKLTNQFKESNGLGYIKFQYVGYWNEVFGYMVGCTVFFATLKFLRLLRFNKRMSLLAATLKNGARSLIHFSVIFWLVFLAFSMLFYLTFMNIDIQYSTFVSSVVSSILMMMGKFDIKQMTMAEPVLTQIITACFVISVTFIIVNMFVSILNETFAAVRDDISKQSNDYEIVSFMLGRFKRFTGLGGQQPTTLSPDELIKEREKQYATGNETERSCVDNFPDRIDRLLHSISNVYMDQESMAVMLDKKGYQASDGKGYQASGGKGYGGGKGNPGSTPARATELSKVHTH